MDDIIILDGSKDFLHSLREPIEKYLKQELNLEIKSNWQIYPVDARGIDFVGYRHFHGYTLVRKKTARHFIKETNKINICGNQRIYPTEQQYHFWISSSGWIAWANAYNLIKKYYIQPGIISVNQFYQVYIASKVKYKKGKRRKSFNKNRLIKQMKQHKIFKYKYYNSHKHLHYNKKGVFI